MSERQKNGAGLYLDRLRLGPRTVESHRALRTRGAPDAAPLEVRMGATKGVIFRASVRGAELVKADENTPRGIVAGTFAGWSDAVLYMAADGDTAGARFVRLAPGADSLDVDWRGFYARGGARVVEELTGPAATAAWHARERS